MVTTTGRTPTDVGTMEFRTTTRVLGVMSESGVNVVGFLDVLFWRNRLAVTDPATKHVRTNLMHSDQLVVVVSPSNVSRGSRAARRVLLPLVHQLGEEYRQH